MCLTFPLICRSQASGNCLYSSASLALVGNNSLINHLRSLTSIELFLRTDFYSQHPYFLSSYSNHGDNITHNLKHILPVSVSQKALDSCLSGSNLVMEEATLNCLKKICY